MTTGAIEDELARAMPLLRQAVRRSPGERLQAAVDAVLANRAQLWAGARYAMVTQLVAGPDERVIHVWLCAGDLAEVLAARPTIESWARQQGACAATLRGRPGWARVLAPFGFAAAGDELRKAL